MCMHQRSCLRRWSSCQASASTGTLHRVSRSTRRARVTYSTFKNQIDVDELAALLQLVAPTQPLSDHQRVRQLHFGRWQTPTDDLRHSLTQCVDKSIAVVAAYSRQPLADDGEQGTADGWPWHNQPIKLVGFARAMGDRSLVASVYDLAVHPAVQQQGIGRRLLQLLVHQLQMQGIYDIGCVTPTETREFFTKCSFDKDREGSTPMTFTGSLDQLPLYTQHLQSQEGLQTLLKRKLNDDALVRFCQTLK